jgi:hypothetical protein
MKLDEILSEMATNVVRIVGSRTLAKVGDTDIFEYTVMLIANAEGAQRMATQTVYVKDYLGVDEVAVYGERKLQNYVEPSAETDPILDVKNYLDQQVSGGAIKSYAFHSTTSLPNDRLAGLFLITNTDDTTAKVAITKDLDGNILQIPADY